MPTETTLTQKEFEKKLVAEAKAKAEAEYKQYERDQKLKAVHTELGFETPAELIQKLMELHGMKAVKKTGQKRETVNAGSTEKIKELARAGKTISEVLSDLKVNGFPAITYQTIRGVYVRMQTAGEEVRFK